VTPVVIYGAGGHGKVIADILERDPAIGLIGWLDDDPRRHGSTFFGHPVVGGLGEVPGLLARGVRHAVVAIGDNVTRDRVAATLTARGMVFVAAIHPSAQLGRGVSVAAGAAIMAGAVVNADTSIGEHAIVNTGATVDHDCRIGRAAHVAVGAHVAGGVTVGDLTLVALGASVGLCVTIGARVVVGAGAVVLEDLPDDVLAVGVPARPVRRDPR
jgi:UDP-perosamine 4-acetyltransferase